MTLMPANTQTLSGSIRVAAPPAKLWELITTIAKITEWYDSWDAVEHDPDEERLQVGTSFRLIRHRVGRNDIALCRVTFVAAPRRLCWLQFARKLPPMSVEFQLLPDADTAAGTLLNHTISWMD
jgi:uncharacterized protein YndB with AHSA1/START domain